MSVADIAEHVSRSKAWVSMRLGLIGEMSEAVRERMFSGEFPVYPYMYTLRQFMRMNGVKKQDIEDFVVAVSGNKQSVREIEQLAHGIFSRAGVVSRSDSRGTYGAGVGPDGGQVPEDP